MLESGAFRLETARVALRHTLRIIWNHPITRGDRTRAVLGFFRWQLGSRLVDGPVVVPLVNDARLVLRRGMHGATGNLYVGLQEFEDMAFVLHALRPDELFVDIGANVGVYTVLAGAVGARSVAFEPVPDTYRDLLANLAINDLGERAEARNEGLGRAPGTLRFTTGEGPVNHVVGENEASSNTLELPVVTLDAALGDRTPTLMKIDVEGFETEVLAGARDTLARPGLQAIVIELNESGARYGYRDDAIHADLLGFGFEPVAYDPFERSLRTLERNARRGNTLYVRGRAEIAERLRDADAFAVKGIRI